MKILNPVDNVMQKINNFTRPKICIPYQHYFNECSKICLIKINLYVRHISIQGVPVGLRGASEVPKGVSGDLSGFLGISGSLQRVPEDVTECHSGVSVVQRDFSGCQKGCNVGARSYSENPEGFHGVSGAPQVVSEAFQEYLRGSLAGFRGPYPRSIF